MFGLFKCLVGRLSEALEHGERQLIFLAVLFQRAALGIFRVIIVAIGSISHFLINGSIHFLQMGLLRWCRASPFQSREDKYCERGWQQGKWQIHRHRPIIDTVHESTPSMNR